jgi:protein required for attachment to host cells
MNKTCIVVADGRLARFYGVEAVESPRQNFKLVEQTALANPNSDLRKLGESTTGRVRTETNTNRAAGPMHPMAAQRERHRDEFDRRFVQEISRQAADLTRGWKEGAVVLVAEPRLLGLMREPLRKAVHQGIELKELAKDYAQSTTAELRDQLASSGILPPHRGSAQ